MTGDVRRQDATDGDDQMNQDYKAERDLKRRIEMAVAIGEKSFDRATVIELLAAWRNEGERLLLVATELKAICRTDADVSEAHRVVATWQPVFAREGWMGDNVRAQIDEWENTEAPDGT